MAKAIQNLYTSSPRGKEAHVGHGFRGGLHLADDMSIFHTNLMNTVFTFTEIGKKSWLFAKLQPGRARKKINAP